MKNIYKQLLKNTRDKYMQTKYDIRYESDYLCFDASINCYIKNNKLEYFSPRIITKYELRNINKFNEQIWNDEVIEWEYLTSEEQELIKDELALLLHQDGIDSDKMEYLYKEC